MRSLLRLFCRIYQALLYAYPTDFRRRYGTEMMQVFRDRSRDAAQASGLRGLLHFGIRCGADWLITTVRERADSACAPAEGPVIAAHAFEGVPGFYTCESYFPRRSALINGGIWTLAAFSTVCSAIDHPGVRYRFRSAVGGSYVARQPEVIETGESGPVAFGRSLLTSAGGAFEMLLQSRPTAAGSNSRPGRGRTEGLRSNLVWLLSVRPHFPRLGSGIFSFAVSAQQSTKATPGASKPNFSGRWELDVARSKAPAQLPEMELAIDHKDPVLKWTTTFKDENATKMMLPFLMVIADSQAELRADGKDEVVRTGLFERRSRTVWEGQRLVTSWTMKTPQDPPQGCWVRSLSADGKTQTVDIEFKSAMMGTLEVTLIFSKLPTPETHN